MEIRRQDEFNQSVINPTHKLVWINVKGFVKFLEWNEHENGY